MAARSQTSSRSEWETGAKRLLARWGPNPVLCLDELCGLKLWPKQAAIARSIVEHKRTACKSGHKVGKSTSAAGIALWWVLTRWRGRVILTAPAGHQVRNILWPEVTRLYESARVPVGGRLSPDPAYGLKLPGNREIIAVTTDEVAKAAGLSSPNQLIIVDEASGYDEDLWPALFGNLAGGGRILATGNPTQTSGTFYEAFTEKAHLWNTFTISCIETPNVIANRCLIPGIAMRDYITEHLDEYAGIRLDPQTCTHAELVAALESAGESPFLDIRIRGRFPVQGDHAVVPLTLVETGKLRWATTLATDGLSLGVDVARTGDDDSVIAPRRGNKLYPLEPHHGLDGPELAARVVECANRLRPKPSDRVRVKIDEIGVGASPYDCLVGMASAANLEVIGVNAGAAADDPERFRNKRAQMHFAVRSWLADGGALPPNEGKLYAELVAAKFSLDERNRYVVEKKDAIKARLRRSPDRADAVGLAVYEPPTFDLEIIRGASRFD